MSAPLSPPARQGVGHAVGGRGPDSRRGETRWAPERPLEAGAGTGHAPSGHAPSARGSGGLAGSPGTGDSTPREGAGASSTGIPPSRPLPPPPSPPGLPRADSEPSRIASPPATHPEHSAGRNGRVAGARLMRSNYPPPLSSRASARQLGRPPWSRNCPRAQEPSQRFHQPPPPAGLRDCPLVPTRAGDWGDARLRETDPGPKGVAATLSPPISLQLSGIPLEGSGRVGRGHGPISLT